MTRITTAIGFSLAIRKYDSVLLRIPPGINPSAEVSGRSFIAAGHRPVVVPRRRRSSRERPLRFNDPFSGVFAISSCWFRKMAIGLITQPVVDLGLQIAATRSEPLRIEGIPVAKPHEWR